MNENLLFLTLGGFSIVSAFLLGYLIGGKVTSDAYNRLLAQLLNDGLLKWKKERP